MCPFSHPPGRTPSSGSSGIISRLPGGCLRSRCKSVDQPGALDGSPRLRPDDRRPGCRGSVSFSRPSTFRTSSHFAELQTSNGRHRFTRMMYRAIDDLEFIPIERPLLFCGNIRRTIVFALRWAVNVIGARRPRSRSDFRPNTTCAAADSKLGGKVYHT